MKDARSENKRNRIREVLDKVNPAHTSIFDILKTGEGEIHTKTFRFRVDSSEPALAYMRICWGPLYWQYFTLAFNPLTGVGNVTFDDGDEYLLKPVSVECDLRYLFQPIDKLQLNVVLKHRTPELGLSSHVKVFFSMEVDDERD